MNRSTPGLPVHRQLPEFTQTHVHGVGDAIQPSHPLSPPSPPAFNLSQHQCPFQWVSSSHQVAKVLEFQLQHQPSIEYSGLISFRMDWLDLLAVQGTLKSLLKHCSSKASILQRLWGKLSQLSHTQIKIMGEDKLWWTGSASNKTEEVALVFYFLTPVCVTPEPWGSSLQSFLKKIKKE